jgi:hypothetical protein
MNFYILMSDQILLSSVEEGDTFTYGRDANGDAKATLYKISAFDKQTDNLLSYGSSESNVIVTMRSGQLPINATYISYRNLFNGDRFNHFKKGKQYLSSENFIQLKILDSDLNKIDIKSETYSIFEA